MCRARYKFSYRARTVGAARCLPPDCETSVHSGNDLVQPCIGARRSVPMADSDGVPGGAARYASLSPRPLPPRSVEFRTEIGSLPARDRFTSGSRSVHFRTEIGSLPARDRFGSGSRSVHLRTEIGPRRPPGVIAPWKVVLPCAFGSSLPRPAPHLAENRALMRVGGCSSAGANGRGSPPWSPLRPGPPLLRSSRRVTDPGAVIGVGQGPGDWQGFAVRTGRRGEMKARGGTRLPGRGLRVGTASGRPPGGRNVNVPFQHQRTFLPSY